MGFIKTHRNSSNLGNSRLEITNNKSSYRQNDEIRRKLSLIEIYADQ